MSQKKLKVGVLGATGMVGQRFLALLENHPWYDVTLLGASANSAGQKYADAVKGRWALKSQIPVGARRARREERLRREGDRRAGRLRLLRRRHVEGGDGEARGGLREGRDAGRLEQLRPPRHPRRADDDPGGEPGARRRHRGAAEAARDEARVHRGEAELLDPELRPGAPPAHEVRAEADRGLHLPGDLGRREDLRDLAGDGGQPHPLHQGRGGEVRAGADEDLGLRRRRQDREGEGPDHHRPVHPRARHATATWRRRSSSSSGSPTGPR